MRTVYEHNGCEAATNRIGYGHGARNEGWGSGIGVKLVLGQAVAARYAPRLLEYYNCDVAIANFGAVLKGEY